MVMFLGIVAVAAAWMFVGFDTIPRAFMANRWLNGLIIGVILLGVGYIFRQVISLSPEVDWIETFRRNEPSLAVQKPPRLLASMATMLGERQGRLSLSAMSMRALLDSIASRLDESRDISRYLIALLIFLGLLGTFWGLLDTIFSVAAVIQGLSVGEGDITAIFDDLKKGLQAPLSGMGTAFSSSLFGLAGSLVLGFLDLQASQAQNRFYNDLEDWLSSLTRLGSGIELGDGGQSVPAYVSALLEQTAESLDTLQRTLTQGESSRSTADLRMLDLTEKLATLTDQMRAAQTLMVKLAENQMDLKPILQRLTDLSAQTDGGVDEVTRGHIRNIDVYMTRLLEETVSGRTQLIDGLRSEIKLLARTIAAQSDANRR
jgi:hypothetical protein